MLAIFGIVNTQLQPATACVRDCSGKPGATRYEWRGLGTESPTRRLAGHAQKCNNLFNLTLNMSTNYGDHRCVTYLYVIPMKIFDCVIEIQSIIFNWPAPIKKRWKISTLFVRKLGLFEPGRYFKLFYYSWRILWYRISWKFSAFLFAAMILFLFYQKKKKMKSNLFSI